MSPGTCVNRVGKAPKMERILSEEYLKIVTGTLVYCHLNKFINFKRKKTFQLADQIPGTQSQSGSWNRSHSSSNLTLEFQK